MSPKSTPRPPNDVDALVRRLDVLIALQLAVPAPTETSPIKDQIRRLTKLGLDNATIGQILGKKSNYVSASAGSKKPLRKRSTRPKRRKT